MATANKRSKKSTPASTKAAKKAASRTATTSGKAGARKAASKKTASKAPTKPSTSGGGSAKKAASRKAATARKTAPKAKPARSAPKAKPAASAKPATGLRTAAKAVKVARKASKAARKAVKQVARRARTTTRAVEAARSGDAALFAPLTDGERAEAVRILTEDPRLASMASVGRYRVIVVEPLVLKPPHEAATHRLARTIVYDYSSERSVDACVDLDTGKVAHLHLARTQPMLAREEEEAAIDIALADDQVKSKLALGDEPQVAMHYWSRRNTSLAYSRRSAAVLFGQPHSRPTLIAVVDLLDNLVCEIVPAAEW